VHHLLPLEQPSSMIRFACIIELVIAFILSLQKHVLRRISTMSKWYVKEDSSLTLCWKCTKQWFVSDRQDNCHDFGS